MPVEQSLQHGVGHAMLLCLAKKSANVVVKVFTPGQGRSCAGCCEL